MAFERAAEEFVDYITAEQVMIDRYREELKQVMTDYPEYRDREIGTNEIVEFLIAKGISEQWRDQYNADQALTLDLNGLRYHRPEELPHAA